MDKVWKAGDTCTIKPSRSHGIGKAKCASLWTIDSLNDTEACVHNGAAGHLDIRTAPGLTCAARVPLAYLLPPGDAHPTIAAEMGAEVLRLRAENAELLATLANERGEGEAPVEGWRYIPSLGDWQAPTGVVRRISWLRLPDGTSKACWGWERWEADGGRTDGVCDTARAAMRAASGAP